MSRHPYDPWEPQYPQRPQQVHVTVQRQQANMLLRTAYFIFIGWWAAALWALTALAFCITIIGLPVGIAMLNRLGFILTLRE